MEPLDQVSDVEVGFEMIDTSLTWLYQKGGWTLDINGHNGDVTITGDGDRKLLGRMVQHMLQRAIVQTGTILREKHLQEELRQAIDRVMGRDDPAQD